MCAVFYVDDGTVDAFRARDGVRDQLDAGQWDGRDIHPNDKAPVLTVLEGGERLCAMRFGIPAGAAGRSMIFNARAESAEEKRLFAPALASRRAVICAARFDEWNSAREKSTFSRPDGKPLCLAGFYDLWDNEERFVILTTEANESMRPVHSRMPLILEWDQMTDWLMRPECTAGILRMRPLQLSRTSDYEQLSLFSS